MRASSPPWKTCWKPTRGREIPIVLSCAWARSDPAQARKTARRDYEYQRNGVSLHDLRAAGGLARRGSDRPHGAVDYAKVLKELSDVHFPAAEKIELVQ